MATWEGFQIQIPAQGLLRDLEQILETLLVFMEIVKSILEVVKVFLLLFANPLILLLEALMALIMDLYHMLMQTGVYAYFDLPDLAHDPNFKSFAGGSAAFKARFKGSLLDLKDSHRPQPTALLQGGFVLMVIDADGPLILIQIIKAIIAFFRNPSKIVEPQYPAPVHLKAVPIDKAGSPILDIENLLSNQSKSLAIEWQLPGIVPSASAGFTGLTAMVIQNFRVPNWLIEIGTAPPTQPIVITPDPVTQIWSNSAMYDSTTCGRVVQNVPTLHTDPRNIGGKSPTTQVPLLDDHHDPVVKFSFYTIVDGFTALLADLGGTVRFVWDNIPLDTVYYIRVRAFFGTLSVNEFGSDGFCTLNWPLQLITDGQTKSAFTYLKWPSASATDISIGKPSTMIRAQLASVPDFDVMGDLRALFGAAFALNFHVSLPASQPETGPVGTVLVDSHGNVIYQPQFDSGGNPIPPLTSANIGYGSLQGLSGSVSTIYPVAAQVAPYYPTNPVPASFFAADASGHTYQWPWQDPIVQAQANKLAIKFGNILLEQGKTQISAFKQVMRGPLSAGAVPGYSSLEQLVLSVTATVAPDVSTPPGTSPSVAAAYEAAQAYLNTTVPQQTAQAYMDIFSCAVARRNVLAGINYLKSLGFQGVPNDWLSMSIMDLIPWSGQILRQLIGVVQGLIDAFKALIQEIIDYINLIERKINALEIFIEYLISILNFLLSLNVGFYLLFEPKISGDVTAWFNAIDSTAGTPPMSGPDGYTAGICLAYLLPDVSAIADAFGLIF
jgi:hypothetical protein